MTSNTPVLSSLLETMKNVDLRIFKAKHYGETNGEYIKTNTKRGDVVNTIIHELMHIKHPKKSEKQIQKISATVEGSLTMRDQAKLLDTYEGNLMREEDRRIMYPNFVLNSVMKRIKNKK